MSVVPVGRIGDLCEQVRGVTYSKDDAVAIPRAGFKPVLRANNITEHGLTFDDLVFVPEKNLSDRQYIKKNDIVIAASSGSISVVGKAARATANFDGAFGAFCKVLRPSKKIDPGYFSHFFQTKSYRQRISYLAAGANINNLRNEHLNDLEISLPPLPQQRRIAEILDKADALRTTRREAIAKLDKLLQSVFLDMFGANTDWPSVAIGNICEVKGGKRLPKGEDYANSPTPFRYIRVSDIERGRILEEDLKFLKPEVQERIKRYTVSNGDVVITIAGTIGVVAPVGPTLNGANLTENAAKLVSLPLVDYESEYLSFALSTTDAQQQIKSQTGQATIGKLALFRIEKVEITMPPKPLQTKFTEVKKAIGEQHSRMNISSAALDRAFESLQQRAFSGVL